MARSDRKLDQEIEAFLNEVRNGFYFCLLSFINKIKKKDYIALYATHTLT